MWLIRAIAHRSWPVAPRTIAHEGMASDLNRRTDREIQEIRSLCKVASISYGVLHQGNVVLERGIGVRDSKSNLKPDSNTMYLLISISKTIVAAATGILVDQGKLHWSDLIKDHIPEFHPDPKIAEVSTVFDLLRHTSGLKNPVVSILGPKGLLVSKEEDFINIINESPTTAPNGDTFQFEYSNIGFALAAKIIEKASGETFSDFVEENLLRPLRMTRTACTKAAVKGDANLAPPCVWNGADDYRELRCEWTDETRTSILGSLGFRGSLHDMLIWCAATMSAENDYNFDDHGALEGLRNPLKKMDMIRSTCIAFEPRDGDIEPPGYCLGWFRAKMPTSRLGWGTYNELTQDLADCVKEKGYTLGLDSTPRTIIKHTGLGAGASVAVWTFPETCSAVVVLTNGLDMGDASDFTAQVLTQALFDLEPKVDILERVKVETELRRDEFDSKIIKEWETNRDVDMPERAYEELIGDYYGLGIALHIRTAHGGLTLKMNGNSEAIFTLNYYGKDQYSFFPHDREEWLNHGWLDWDFYKVGILQFQESGGLINGLLWTWEEFSGPAFFRKGASATKSVG